MNKTLQAARRLSVLLCLIALCVSSYAQDEKPPPLLLITDLRTSGDEASVAESRAYGELIRREIERAGLFRVLSDASMRAVIRAGGVQYPCFELPCFVNLGRRLGADLVLAGHLQRRQSTIEITLRLVNVENADIHNAVYQKSETHTMSDLLGDWGLALMAELLEIELDGLADDAPSVDEMELLESIPPEIRYKHPGMVYVPAGETVLGANDGDPIEQPPHRVEVEAFYIGLHPVTNREYREFIDSTGRGAPRSWPQGQIPVGQERHPVTWVSFEDAEAYCQWRGGRLPTEDEWVRAARANSPRRYPWGDEFVSDRANTWESGLRATSEVGAYPQGASPFGALDMSGNVFEWTASFLTPYPGANLQNASTQSHLRVLHGGSWNFDAYYARISHRLGRPGGEHSRSFGFRMAMDADAQ